MGWGWLASAGISALGGVLGSRRNNRRMRNAYNLAKQETQAEKEYRLKLEKESKFGDPEIEKKRNQLYRPIFSQSRRARADATGTAVRQGLENSIIAMEMKSKIDAQTYQALDEQADRITSYNEQYKKDAENKLMQYKLQRDSRLRDLAVGYQSNLQSTSFSDQLLPAVLNIAGQWATSTFGSNWNFGGGTTEVNSNLIPTNDLGR
ncbi:MAG: hypothetical protein CMP21_08815 [Rickettsiales bacterium]|nr:hypothetical protein [Rickettsiales bacterium]